MAIDPPAPKQKKAKVREVDLRLAEVERGVSVLKKVGELAEAPSSQGENLNTGVDRITFSAPATEEWPRRIEERRKASGYRSTSETVRALLEEALKP